MTSHLWPAIGSTPRTMPSSAGWTVPRAVGHGDGPGERRGHRRPGAPQFRHGAAGGLSQGDAADEAGRTVSAAGPHLRRHARRSSRHRCRGARSGRGDRPLDRGLPVADVPIVATIVGEGGSGGAIALAAGDRVLMLEHSIYSVISPEGCAAILWRSADQAPAAAEALKLTAQDLLDEGWSTRSSRSLWGARIAAGPPPSRASAMRSSAAPPAPEPVGRPSSAGPGVTSFCGWARRPRPRRRRRTEAGGAWSAAFGVTPRLAAEGCRRYPAHADTRERSWPTCRRWASSTAHAPSARLHGRAGPGAHARHLPAATARTCSSRTRRIGCGWSPVATSSGSTSTGSPSCWVRPGSPSAGRAAAARSWA